MLFRSALLLVVLALIGTTFVEAGCSGCYVGNGGTTSSDIAECPSDSPLLNEADTCSCQSDSSDSGGGGGGGGGGWTLSSPSLRKPDWRQRMAADYYKSHPQHRRLSTCSQSSCCETQSEMESREEGTTIGIAVGVSAGVIALIAVAYCFLKSSGGGVPVAEGVPIPMNELPKKQVRGK